MLKHEYSVAMAGNIHEQLKAHLVREDKEEDLIFALWTPSIGDKRLTALVHTLIHPEEGDRQRHGNASFNPQYRDRVMRIALEKNCGVAFIHSHPNPGWQDMSQDDVVAENKLMGAAASVSGLPLLGMTIGSDGIWSGRFWVDEDGISYDRKWSRSVRVLGKTLTTFFNDHLVLPPVRNEMFKRTLSVWGNRHHADITRLRIGIVGLGSVGGAVAISLARSGFTNLTFIDHDEIQPHNLDRIDYATQAHLGQLKVDAAKQRCLEVGTASKLDITCIPYSVAEPIGYSSALDCDIIFCCVDRPRPRSILNHFAYAHLIPVIDGGIRVRFRGGDFSGVDWQLQTAGPGRACLECIGTFNWDDVATEIEGKLDDPSYLSGLPETHKFRRNENVYVFSQNLASLEVLQFIALTTGIAGIEDFGVQRFRYNPGIVESNTQRSCHPSCMSSSHIASGDSHFCLEGVDYGAEYARKRQIAAGG